MKFEDAIQISGGHSAGGQLIVHHNGKNVLVGRHHDGHLIVENTDEAREVFAAITAAAPADPLDHDGDGKKGGSKPRRRQKPEAAQTEAETETEVEPETEPTELQIDIEDAVDAAEQVG